MSMSIVIGMNEAGGPVYRQGFGPTDEAFALDEDWNPVGMGQTWSEMGPDWEQLAQSVLNKIDARLHQLDNRGTAAAGLVWFVILFFLFKRKGK